MQRTPLAFTGAAHEFVEDEVDDDGFQIDGWRCTHNVLLLCQKCGGELHTIMTTAKMEKHSYYEELIMTISIEPCAKCVADAVKHATWQSPNYDEA